MRFEAGATLTTGLKKRVERGTGPEAKKVAQRLGSFDVGNTPVTTALQQYFSSGVTHKELISIAQIAAQFTGTGEPDRLAVRDCRALLKWFFDNWAAIQGVIPFIHLRDGSDRIISLEREIKERTA
jgi:hypothetical protein